MALIGKRVNEEVFNLGVPDMPTTVVDYLDSLINENWVLYEWGSGASTFWFAERCSKIISVEYLKVFYEYLLKVQQERMIPNTKMQFCYVPPDSSKNPNYIASHSSAKGLSFRVFAHHIDQYPDDTFDMIVIDGRVRNRCLQLAVPKVKSGGYIVYDDTEREAYKKEIAGLADNFSEIRFFQGVKPPTGRIGETAILRKL